jgi:hypothetical protein
MSNTKKDEQDNVPEEIILDEFVKPPIPSNNKLYPSFYECDKQYSCFEHHFDYIESSEDSSDN